MTAGKKVNVPYQHLFTLNPRKRVFTFTYFCLEVIYIYMQKIEVKDVSIRELPKAHFHHRLIKKLIKKNLNTETFK